MVWLYYWVDFFSQPDSKCKSCDLSVLLCWGTTDLYAYCKTSFHLQKAFNQFWNSKSVCLLCQHRADEKGKKRSRHSFHIRQEKHMEETLLDLIRTTSVSTTVLTAKLLFRQKTASNMQKLSLNYRNSHNMYNDSLKDVAKGWGVIVSCTINDT